MFGKIFPNNVYDCQFSIKLCYEKIDLKRFCEYAPMYKQPSLLQQSVNHAQKRSVPLTDHNHWNAFNLIESNHFEITSRYYKQVYTRKLRGNVISWIVSLLRGPKGWS